MQVRKGEVREVGFEFTHVKGESFVIDGADFTITASDGSTVLSGYAQVNDNKVVTIFNATNTGTYIVKFACHIGSEIYRPQETVKVVE